MKRARIRRPHEPSQLSIDREIARVLSETCDSPLDFVELAYPCQASWRALPDRTAGSASS